MKQGMTINELAAEVSRQRDTKRDFIIDTTHAGVETDTESPMGFLHFTINGKMERFTIGETAHDQLAARLQIPKPYYERMIKDYPELWQTNVNGWLHKQSEKRMVRTLDGRMRAFLSERYRPLDHYDLLEAALPTVMEHKWDIKSCAVGERRLFLKVVSEEIRHEVIPAHGSSNHIVHPGFLISNSEIGLGHLSVQPTIHWQYCLNLASLGGGLHRSHVGKANANVEDVEEFFSDETRRLSDAAIWSQAVDIIKATLSTQVFLRMVARFQSATAVRIDKDPVGAVTEVQKRFTLNKEDHDGILKHLIEGGDLSTYGLSSAVTRHSQDVEQYDHATELERVGGAIIELPQENWRSFGYEKAA